MSQCPYCDYVAEDGQPWQEIAHMQLEHPEVIAERLVKLGPLDASPRFHGYQACRICGLPEERHGLCSGHREEWILWAASRPDEQTDEGFDRWIDGRRAELGRMAPE